MACVDNGPWYNENAIRGLGVCTSVSTTKNVYQVNNTGYATNISRTTGWHQFKWDYTWSSNVKMYIDGILVATIKGVTNFNQIAIGDWRFDGIKGPCYFDDVLIK